MTDPEVTAEDPPAAPAPAAPWTPTTSWDPPTAHDTVTAEAPAAAPGTAQPAAGPAGTAPRRRRRWLWVTLVTAVVVAGLAAGLVVWAPWIPPPVLRPAGLAAGRATPDSVSLRWSRPATGPLPDKYLVYNNGMSAGSVAGTTTSFTQTDLTPATSYQVRVVAERGGKRSPQSAALTVRTVTPPVSQGRMQGSWLVSAKLTQGPLSRKHWGYSWVATPACAAGLCDTKLHVGSGRHAFSVKLAQAGGVYRGQATVSNFIRCGPGGGTFVWDPATVSFRLHVTAAIGQPGVWVATSLAGTIVGHTQYVSGGAYYCPAGVFRATLSGSTSAGGQPAT